MRGCQLGEMYFYDWFTHHFLLLLWHKGIGFWGTIIPGLFISLSFWRCNLHFLIIVFPHQWIFGIWGDGIGLCNIGGPMIGMSILDRVVLPTSVDDPYMMLSNSFSCKKESLSLDSIGACVFCNIIDCLF